MLRLPWRPASIGVLGFRPLGPVLAADADLRAVPAATARNQGPVAAAFAASALVHALLGLGAALVIGGSGLLPAPASTGALRATLSSPPQRFAVPEPRVEPPPPAAPNAATAVSQRPRAPVPLPIVASPTPKAKVTGLGRVVVQVVEFDETPDPATLAGLRRAHPRAMRVVPEFESEPAGIYPDAALAGRRQSIVSVVVIVHPDGGVELAPETFDEPIFGASIRNALTAAKARPPEVDGKPATGWALLRFYFEFVGSDPAADAPASSR